MEIIIYGRPETRETRNHYSGWTPGWIRKINYITWLSFKRKKYYKKRKKCLAAIAYI